MDMGSGADGGIVLDKESISSALREITHDRGGGGRALPTWKWESQEECNCQSMVRKADPGAETAEIIPFYSEYMYVVRVEAARFSVTMRAFFTTHIMQIRAGGAC